MHALDGVTRKTTRGATLPVLHIEVVRDREKRDQILIDAHVWANELTWVTVPVFLFP
jgi:hypothetical protein